jgi:hypothetical protein
MENGNSVVQGLGLATLWQNPIAIIVVAVLIFALVFMIIKAAKKGLFSFSRGGISIGIADREREIIKTQLDKAESSITGFYNKMGYKRDDYRKLYIMSEVEDLLYKAVAVNHINTSPTYISLKQEAVWSVICQHAETNLDEDLHAKVNEALEKLIRELVDIRTYINNGKK